MFTFSRDMHNHMIESLASGLGRMYAGRNLFDTICYWYESTLGSVVEGSNDCGVDLRQKTRPGDHWGSLQSQVIRHKSKV